MPVEDILNPSYWQQRLLLAPTKARHHAIFRCPTEVWERIEAKHRQILAEHIQPNDSILDAGCGWGRLLTLLPETWRGRYNGVDISPDFIMLARHRYPRQSFAVWDLQKLSELSYLQPPYDWAVMISMRPMIRRNLGEEVWTQIETEIRKLAKKLLYLEYDDKSDGFVE